MTSVVLLLGYAVALSVVCPPLLRQARWVDRAPSLAIATWHALTASVLLAVVCAGFAAAIPVTEISGSIARLLEACVIALRAQYATPGGATVGVVGGALALAVSARALFCLLATLASTSREQRSHWQALRLIARPDPGLDAFVVEHRQATAYCLPGRGQIVLTTGALASLDSDQLRAVLAHERAHLRGRHHLILAVSEALNHAFPRVALFRIARQEVIRLVELAADDIATRTASRLSVAEALLTLAGTGKHPLPARSLAASGSNSAARVRRLLSTQRPLGRLGTVLGIAAITAAVAAPISIGVQPALAAARADCCHVEQARQAEPCPGSTCPRPSA